MLNLAPLSFERRSPIMQKDLYLKFKEMSDVEARIMFNKQKFADLNNVFQQTPKKSTEDQFFIDQNNIE